MSDYPSRPGFVRDSDTSEAAANSLDDADLGFLRGQIWRFIASRPHGATCDETEVALGLRHQTASARLRELFLGGWVFTGDECRLTRSMRRAHVYRVKKR